MTMLVQTVRSYCYFRTVKGKHHVRTYEFSALRDMYKITRHAMVDLTYKRDETSVFLCLYNHRIPIISFEIFRTVSLVTTIINKCFQRTYGFDAISPVAINSVKSRKTFVMRCVRKNAKKVNFLRCKVTLPDGFSRVGTGLLWTYTRFPLTSSRVLFTWTDRPRVKLALRFINATLK